MRVPTATLVCLLALGSAPAAAEVAPAEVRAKQARELTEIGTARAKAGKLVEAREMLVAAANLWRGLARTDPLAYRAEMAATLEALGGVERRLNQTPATQGQLASVRDAATYESRGNYPAALRSYEEALKTWRSLPAATQAANRPKIAQVLGNLARLHARQQQYGHAEDYYHMAIAIQSELAKADPASHGRDLAALRAAQDAVLLKMGRPPLPPRPPGSPP